MWSGLGKKRVEGVRDHTFLKMTSQPVKAPSKLEKDRARGREREERQPGIQGISTGTGRVYVERNAREWRK